MLKDVKTFSSLEWKKNDSDTFNLISLTLGRDGIRASELYKINMLDLMHG
jgi:hypothetical protein